MGGPRKIMHAGGYLGGNKTFGTNRKGYRGGRIPTYPKDTVTWPITVKLSDQDYAIAVYLGLGNAARGVRIAIQHAAGRLAPTVSVPSTRIEAERIVRPAKKRVAVLVSNALGMRVRPPKPAGTHSPVIYDAAQPGPVNPWDDIQSEA